MNAPTEDDSWAGLGEGFAPGDVVRRSSKRRRARQRRTVAEGDSGSAAGPVGSPGQFAFNSSANSGLIILLEDI